MDIKSLVLLFLSLPAFANTWPPNSSVNSAITALPGQKIQCNTASSTQFGCLASADWTTFNGKYNLPALTSGSVLYSNGTTIAQDNALFFWDDTNQRLLIGTNPTNAGPGASGQVEVENAGGSSPSAHAINIYTAGTNNAIELQAQSANVAEMILVNNTAPGGAAITLGRARGTLGSKTQMQAGDVYGGMFFEGYNGSSFIGYGAGIAAVATQSITSSASGGELVFCTSANGANNCAQNNLILDNNKNAIFAGLPILPVQASGNTPTGVSGAIALTHSYIMCVYTGSTWVKVSDGSTSCTF